MANGVNKGYWSVAAQVAERKRTHPGDFCPVLRCLWRTDGAYCPRHANVAPPGAKAILPIDRPSLSKLLAKKRS